MRKLIIISLMGLVHLQCSAQVTFKTITINNYLELIKLSGNAYIHKSYTTTSENGRFSSNGLIFIDNDDAFLFDTPMTDSATMILVTYMEEQMGLKITGFIPNHWHADCMGGLKYLQSHGIDSYANHLTIEIAGKNNLPLPAHGFKDSLHLFLNDKEISCYFLGAAHSLDNIIVWIPSERILFPGCMVRSLTSNNLGNVADGDLTAYPKTIDKLIKKFNTAKIVIPGHGPVGSLDLVKHTKDLLTK